MLDEMAWLNGLRPEMVNTVRAALTAPGDLEPAVRRTILERALAIGTGAAELPDVPAPLRELVDKVSRNAYKVVDRDVAAPAAAGYSPDAVFEAVVATAVGAGMARLTSGLAVLRQAAEDAGEARPGA